MSYRFWNAPKTVVYYRKDDSLDNSTDGLGSDIWRPLGIARGHIKISGGAQYEAIQTDTHQSSQFPSEKIYLGTEYEVSFELAKMVTQQDRGLDESAFFAASSPSTTDPYGFGTAGLGNQPVYDHGKYYNILLWSQVARENTGSEVVHTQYAHFINAVPEKAEMLWGTMTGGIQMSWKCSDTHLVDTDSRMIATYSESTSIAEGPPPALLP